MKKRCDNPKDKYYNRYGGRGISYCQEWNDAANFFKWAFANGYNDNLELDRIDNDGNYTPDNCRFTTHSKNMQIRIDTINFVLNGINGNVSEHAERIGINRHTVYCRVKKGIAPEFAFYPAAKRGRGCSKR